MDVANELPGLTFHLEEWEEQGFGKKLFINIRIRAEVLDPLLAEKVKSKFTGGMKIYAVGDFKDKMISVLKQDYKESAGKVVELEAALGAKVRENLALKQELERIRASFSFLGELG